MNGRIVLLCGAVILFVGLWNAGSQTQRPVKVAQTRPKAEPHQVAKPDSSDVPASENQSGPLLAAAGTPLTGTTNQAVESSAAAIVEVGTSLEPELVVLQAISQSAVPEKMACRSQEILPGTYQLVDEQGKVVFRCHIEQDFSETQSSEIPDSARFALRDGSRQLFLVRAAQLQKTQRTLRANRKYDFTGYLDEVAGAIGKFETGSR